MQGILKQMSWVGKDPKARIVEEMTEEGHVYRLEGRNKGGRCFSCGKQVLSRFRDFKLKLNPSKCELLMRHIIFLGHKVN